MTSTLLYYYIIAIKTLLPVRLSRKQQEEGNQQWLTRSQLCQDASFHGMAFTTVSGNSSAEEDTSDTNVYWKLNPYALEEEFSWMDFFAVSFYFWVDK